MLRTRIIVFLTLLVFASITASACSGTGDITAPSVLKKQNNVSADFANRMMLGMWRISGNADGSGFAVEPYRSSAFHLNTLPFLEPPVNQNVKIEKAFVKWGILNVDIGIRHPFLAQPQFTGFDVKGIVILPGTENRCLSDVVTFPRIEETRLINADGYTRWWNPREFPLVEGYQPIFSYTDGLMGTPDAEAEFESTLNGYKYYADNLGLDQPVYELNTAKRGMFSAGGYNTRRYKFDVNGLQVVFNYAVDASWVPPNHIPPTSVPGDFPIEANQQEPYAFKCVELNNTLYNDGYWGGGDYELEVTVYTWRGLESIAQVTMEIPGAFGPAGTETPVETGGGWAKYILTAHAAAPVYNSEAQVLVRAACTPWREYGGRLVGTALSAFYIVRTVISTTSSGGPPGSIKGFRYEKPVKYEGYFTDDGYNYGAADSRDGYIGVLTGHGYSYSRTYLIESNDGGNSFVPKMALEYISPGCGNMIYGPNGAVHALTSGLTYIYRPSGTGSFTNKYLYVEGITTCMRPGLELDTNTGRLHVFTVSEDRKHLYHMFSDNYADFSSPAIIATTPKTGIFHGAGNTGMRSYLFPDGTFGFVTVEYDYDGGAKCHVYYRYGPVDNLSEPIQVDNGMSAARKSCPDIVVDPGGTIHVAWLDDSPNADSIYGTGWRNQVYYSRSEDGSSFSSPKRLTYNGALHTTPSIVMNLNGAGLPVITFPVSQNLVISAINYRVERDHTCQITIDIKGGEPSCQLDVIGTAYQPGGYGPPEDLACVTIDYFSSVIFAAPTLSISSCINRWQYY